MISRVADNCFWFGRYVERAESTVRLLGVTRDLAFDAELSPEKCWEPVVIVSGEHPRFVETMGASAMANGDIVQRHMTWNEENPVSVVTSVQAARSVARTIREVLSLEVWEEVNQLYLWMTGDEGRLAFTDQREEFYRDVRRRTQLCLGLVRSTMLHDEPMRILWLGVMLERVGQIARILDMHHHTLSGERSTESPHQVVELSLWLSLLRACSGFEGFMKRNSGRVGRGAVVSFLLFEPQFPRSLRYCLGSSLAIMRQLWPKTTAAGVGSRAIAELGGLCDWLDKLERQPNLGTEDAPIHQLLTTIVDRTAEVCGLLRTEMLGPSKVDLPEETPGRPPTKVDSSQ